MTPSWLCPLRTLAQDSGCGLCVAPGDDAGLLAAVERLAADRTLRREMGQQGRTYVLSNMLRVTPPRIRSCSREWPYPPITSKPILLSAATDKIAP